MFAAKIKHENAQSDVKQFERSGHFFSVTALVYYDECGVFHHPISIRLYKTPNVIYCVLKVVHGGYNLSGGGRSTLESSLAKQIAIQKALEKTGVEISPDLYSGLPGINFGSECEEKIAIAIAHALGLDPKRWTLISSGGE